MLGLYNAARQLVEVSGPPISVSGSPAEIEVWP